MFIWHLKVTVMFVTLYFALCQSKFHPVLSVSKPLFEITLLDL